MTLNKDSKSVFQALLLGAYLFNRDTLSSVQLGERIAEKLAELTDAMPTKDVWAQLDSCLDDYIDDSSSVVMLARSVARALFSL